MEIYKIIKDLLVIKHEMEFFCETFAYDSYLSFELPKGIIELIDKKISTFSSKAEDLAEAIKKINQLEENKINEQRTR